MRQSVPLHPKSSPNQHCLSLFMLLPPTSFLWCQTHIWFSFCFSFITATPHPWEDITFWKAPLLRARLWALLLTPAENLGLYFLKNFCADRRGGWEKFKAKMFNGLSPMWMVSTSFWSTPQGWSATHDRSEVTVAWFVSPHCSPAWVKGSLASPSRDLEGWCWSRQRERSVNDRVCNHLREKDPPHLLFHHLQMLYSQFQKTGWGLLHLLHSLDVQLFEGWKKWQNHFFCCFLVSYYPSTGVSFCACWNFLIKMLLSREVWGVLQWALHITSITTLPAPACLNCPSVITRNGNRHPKLITPVHYTDELDWPQSIALMKCHLFKPQPSGGACLGCWDGVLLSGAQQGSQCSVWVMLELRLGWWGQVEHPWKNKAFLDGQSTTGQAECSWLDRAPWGGQSITARRCCKRGNFGCAPSFQNATM